MLAAEKAKKLADRQAKLAIWKAKKEADLAGQTSPRPGSSASTGPPGSPALGQAFGKDTAFKGKFDHKQIEQRAKAAKARMQDDALGMKQDLATGSGELRPGGIASTKPGSYSAISAGFAKVQPTSTGATSNEKPEKIVDLGEDDEADSHEYAKIDMADLDGDDALDAPVEGDEDDGEDLDDLSDSEAAVAARAAAEARAAAAAAAEDENLDIEMKDVAADATAKEEADEEEDEIDPLDAFMNGLAQSGEDSLSTKQSSRNQLRESQITYEDDEEVIMNAVGDDDLAPVKLKKKKEVPTVDHSKIQYEPFRKDFYTEPLEVKEMSAEDVKSLRFELDDIKIQGENVPIPVQKFAQFGLGSQVLDILNNLGYEKPTCIQAQAIPAIMSGRDVIGVAKTGSGKTASFLLPMFRHIKDQRPLENMEGPISLVCAPTRELAVQIYNECKPYLKVLKLRAVCAYGGAPITEQIAALKRGAEIVVCTPGRLIDLLAANQGRVINLQRVTYVVMDEADRMFDMGFEPQIAKMLANIRPDRQCVLFSATFPRKMEGLARSQLDKPVQIIVGGRSTVPKEVTQKVEVISEKDKVKRLLQLLGEELQDEEDKRVLVFTERQETADDLLGKMLRSGYPCVSVHGGREQMDRDESLEDFKAGHVPIMFATSVAARGLDVKQLSLVINFDVPNHLEDYVHRAGRTGRAGKLGTAVTFITPEQGRYSIDIVKALKQSEQEVPTELQGLADKFWAKIQAGTEKRYAGGFGGHGLENLEKQLKAEQKRQRAQYGGEDGPEEEEDDEEDDKIKPKTDEAQSKVGEESKTDSAALSSTLTEQEQVARRTGADQVDELFKGGAQRKEAVDKDDKTSSSAAGGSTGGSKLSRAAAMAAAINSRLSGSQGSARAGVSIDNRGPDAGEYYYKLEINDLPQKARWAVTNRGNVAKILESTGVSITTKGQYYPPGTDPAPGELPKMAVLVEGDTEVVVNTAVAELRRLLKDAIASASVAEARAPVSTSRYVVV